VVHLPLPTIVLVALDALPVLSSDYFFWSGNGLIKCSVADWQRSLRKLFSLAGIKEAHAHRFRDSFSVELLSRGVSIEIVPVLLGHSSIRIPEKHYAPWVKTRQDALEECSGGDVGVESSASIGL
jgi:integrase/recombinase XerD